METIANTTPKVINAGSYPTYEEWKQLNTISLFMLNFKFLSYLWGMETNLYLNCFFRQIRCSYPTYEEWKLYKRVKKYKKMIVLILPMRNGNLVLFLYSFCPLLVLILPMRNGNLHTCTDFSIFCLCVLILPMRNGNDEVCEAIENAVKMFLSYLWGMETSMFQATCRHTDTVLILPMRNGNFYFGGVPIPLFNVLILPMRNGNVYSNSKFCVCPALFLSYLWGMETLLCR